LATFKISLKPNERIYVNGAVIKFDRKTSMEFLNDVHFLLESQIMQAADANTPLKRLYFTIQIQLMAPAETQSARQMFSDQLENLLNIFEEPEILSNLKNIDRLVGERRFHEAMKSLRSLYPIERRIFEKFKASVPFEETELLNANVG